MITDILLAIVIILLLVLILLIYINTKTKDVNIELSMFSALNKLGLNTKVEELTTYARDITVRSKDISETLNTKVGELTTQTEDIRQSHKTIEQMLRVPKERAPFGELSLEIILSDQLPPDMFGIRQKILDGKVPDAHIKSTVGLICIDSKFPLDNYAKMTETKDVQEKESFKRQFIKDVGSHLDKISVGYVCPQKGSAEFAFAYIPSDGIYYFLIIEAYQMLRDYAKKGVQTTSPLTLSFQIELIKRGVQAKKLSEDTEKVRNDIIRLSQQFGELDELCFIEHIFTMQQQKLKK